MQVARECRTAAAVVVGAAAVVHRGTVGIVEVVLEGRSLSVQALLRPLPLLSEDACGGGVGVGD